MTGKRNKGDYEAFLYGKQVLSYAGGSVSELAREDNMPSGRTVTSVLSGNCHPSTTVSKVFNAINNKHYVGKLNRGLFIFGCLDFKNKEFSKPKLEDIKEILLTNLKAKV